MATGVMRFIVQKETTTSKGCRETKKTGLEKPQLSWREVFWKKGNSAWMGIYGKTLARHLDQ
jgi:hypothetical protein